MKAIFSSLLTVLLITGIGCNSQCEEGYFLDIKEMEISATHHAGWQAGVIENKPIPYDSIIIQASFSGTFYSNYSPGKNLNFLPYAMADDCVGLKGSKETIASITVVSLTDFDNDFGVNDTINDVIEASNYFNAGYSDEFKDLSLFLAEIRQGIYLQRNGDAGLFLKLNKKPTEKIIKLRIEVSFTNGEKYSAETIPITIKL